MKPLWVKKYAPASFEQYCFSNKAHRQAIGQLLAEHDIPHLLFVGAPGTGKSTLARLLIEYNEINKSDVLTVDATVNNGVDYIRDKVSAFVTTTGFGDIKVVLLEECDRLSADAQDALRELTIRYSDDCRFIFTANYEHKVTDALKSRVQTYVFEQLPLAGAIRRATEILDAEGVKYDKDTVAELVGDHLPDLRKIIGLLQQHSIGGTLVYTGKSAASDFLELFKAGNWTDLREYTLVNVAPGDLIGLYSSMFETLTECEKLTTSEDVLDSAIVLLEKYQFQHPQSADGYICISALFSELNKLTKAK